MPRIPLGREWDPKTGREGEPVSYDLSSHVSLLGPTGCGKGVCAELPLLLDDTPESLDYSILSLDPSGQNACVSAEARRRAGHQVLMLNPFQLHVGVYPDMASVGFNPLLALDPKNPTRFFEEAVTLGDALVPKESGETQPYFPLSARGLATWLCMYVRYRDGDRAHLGTVRDLLTEHETTDSDGRPLTGLRATAARAVATGHPRIASLAARYMATSREIEGIRSTLDTATRWLLSDTMRDDLAKNGIDFGQMKDRRTTVFAILPAGQELEFHGPWMRLVVTSALNALYRRAGEPGLQTLFMLSEFAQLGLHNLMPITAALGQGRKYGVRLFIVLQNLGQLYASHGQHGAGTFLANSGCTIALTPNDLDSATWMSRRSGDINDLGISASDDPNGQPRINYQERQRPFYPPAALFNLPPFHALVWFHGQERPVPVHLAPYWELPCGRHARPDPYHQGRPAGRSRRLAKSLGLALLLGVAALAGGWLLGG